MPKRNIEEQVSALEQLRDDPASTSTADALRKALQNRNNYVSAKAARLADELGLRDLIPDLLSAFEGFFEDAAKSDPQCWAKNAMSKALGDLGFTESAPFLRGLRHVQMEPVWGGSEDTAGTLRCNCALALVECRDLSDLQLLSYLVEILVDADKTVRVEAARAMGRINRPEAALLLRLRALVGDKEPEVIGACLSALLSIEGREGLPFAERFLNQGVLNQGGADAEEAALAIGLMRGPEAFDLLRRRCDLERDPQLRAVLLAAISLTREPDAVELLIRLVETDERNARAASKALAACRLTEEQEARLRSAGRQDDRPRRYSE